MWYQIQNESEIASPGLLFYKDRIIENIKRMVQVAGDPSRLIPHVKTHKTMEIVLLQMDQGITKFKCATIAEAEMVASAGAKWILIAYQLTGPNLNRLSQLKATFPDVYFATLIDNLNTAKELSNTAHLRKMDVSVFLDVNVGMNRTGATSEALSELMDDLLALPWLKLDGLHIYDGHIRNSEFEQRKIETDLAFHQTDDLVADFKEKAGKAPMIIAGGSPTFNVHTLRPGVFLSPGTNALWDVGYGDQFPDQDFLGAAMIISRIISKPSEGIITLDLGHKAIAAENPIDKRMRILNMENYQVLSQSEEHGVIQIPLKAWGKAMVGDVIYIQPFHICPTVALHEFATVVRNDMAKEEWKIVSRNRRIHI